jgi:2-methylisocitrate lyase-like PEP mutase family enzyme
VLAALGFQAIATSSGAQANTLGRRDGKVSRDEALRTAARSSTGPTCRSPPTSRKASAIRRRTRGDDPPRPRSASWAAPIEDATGDKDKPLYDIGQPPSAWPPRAGGARASFPFMLTARAEGFLRGNTNLDDAIKRLQAYEKAGADVLMAPGLPDLRRCARSAPRSRSRSTSWSASRASRSRWPSSRPPA